MRPAGNIVTATMSEYSYSGYGSSRLLSAHCAFYLIVMRRIIFWLFGVPITLAFLTAWSSSGKHHDDLVNATVVAQPVAQSHGSDIG